MINDILNPKQIAIDALFALLSTMEFNYAAWSQVANFFFVPSFMRRQFQSISHHSMNEWMEESAFECFAWIIEQTNFNVLVSVSQHGNPKRKKNLRFIEVSKCQ